jgi:hypothetical protein
MPVENLIGVKSSLQANMGNQPHCDNGEGVATASSLPSAVKKSIGGISDIFYRTTGILHFSVYTFSKGRQPILEYKYVSIVVALIATTYSIKQDLDKRCIFMYTRTGELFSSSFFIEVCIHDVTKFNRSSVFT